jgi:hypothetical protein
LEALNSTAGTLPAGLADGRIAPDRVDLCVDSTIGGPRR